MAHARPALLALGLLGLATAGLCQDVPSLDLLAVAAHEGPAAPAQPAWRDVAVDTTGGFRPSNKVSIAYELHGRRLTTSIGSSTADHLVAKLQELRRQGARVGELEIKGHGAPELQVMGADTLLIATSRDVIAHLRDGRDVTITTLLRDVLAPDAKVNLNGCKTGRGTDSVAQNMSRALPGRTVTGGALYQMGVPFTALSWGTKMHYKDGALVAKKWYRVD